MSRTFKKEHSYSIGTPNTRERYVSRSDNVAFHSPYSINSKYTHSNYGSRDPYEEVPALDIKNINHEAIRNDPELRNLSRNPSAFNSYPIRYYDEYDSEEDIYTEVVKLGNDTEENQSRSSYNSRENPKYNEETYTPSLDRSYNTQQNEPFVSLEKEEQEVSLTVTYKALKAIAFVLFMIYWVVSEPIIRTIAFITMLFSAMIFDPIKHLWVRLTIRETLIQHQKIIKYFITLTVLGVCLLPIPLIAKPYFDASLILQYQPNRGLSQLESISADNKAIWLLLEKIQNTELKNIWDKLKDHQAQINHLRDSINAKVTQALEAKLPDMILVQTNKDGDLEISPKLYTYLQDTVSWDNFLQQNNKSIAKYISGEMSYFFEQQEKQGAIVNKNTFMKLLANDLIHHQGPTAENAEVSFIELVNNAIQNYHQDVLNTADFALESRGASILESLTSPTFYSSPNWKRTLRHFIGLHEHVNSPRFAITSTTHAGECWSMLGSHGNLTIKLSEPVIIQSVTLEYPSAEIMMDNMTTAPKEMSVYGLNHYHQSTHPTYLGHFTYDINKGSPIQTFDIISPQENTYRAISFKVLSNWGSNERTDIYRIRVHGRPEKN